MKTKPNPVKREELYINFNVKMDYSALIADLEKLTAILKKLNQPSKKQK